MSLSIKQAEAYVRKTDYARWDNYTIVLHRPNPSAEYSRAGKFDRTANAWGFETRIEVSDAGTWVLPKQRR